MVKIAIVGTGGVSKRHIASLLTLDNAEIVAITDMERKRAEAQAAACGATVYDSLDDCLELVDVVYILTPPSTHREIAVKAMTAGKHVVCEKPISITIEDAKEMVKTAKKENVYLIVAFKSRFRKGFVRLKRIVESGKLGDIVNIWSQRIGYGAGVSPGYNWRTDPDLLCGMSIESLSHDIDLIRWIAGDVVDVRASIFNTIKNLPGFDNNANIVFTFGSGAIGMIHASWSSYLGVNSRGVIGTNGTAYVEGPGLFDLKNFHWKLSDMEDEHIEVVNNPNDVTGFINENKHFIDCIEKKEEPSVSGDDGLKTLEISHAILESHRKGKVITLNS